MIPLKMVVIDPNVDMHDPNANEVTLDTTLASIPTLLKLEAHTTTIISTLFPSINDY